MKHTHHSAYFRLIAGALLVSGLLVFQSVAEDPELEYADLLFQKKEFHEAAKQYQFYIDRFPYRDATPLAILRLGQSYQSYGREEKAREAFQRLVHTGKHSDKVGEASFQLGMYHFKAEKYGDAVIDFERATRMLASEELRYEAKFYNARSLQLIDKSDLALALYEQLIRKSPGPDSEVIREKSMLQSANILAGKEDFAAAQDFYQQLIDSAKDSEVREEAVVRAALEAVTSGDIDAGEEILKGVSKFRKNSPWKGLSEVGAIFIANAREDYDRVVSIYSSGAVINNAGEYRSKVLLMVANAFRIKGDLKASDRLYQLVEGRYPDTAEGIEAGYRRLTMLYKVNSGVFPTAVDKYAVNLASREPENPFIDKSWLMLGEWHFFQAEKGVATKKTAFAKDQYAKAATAYTKIREEQIPEALIPTMLFHHSWASLESGDIAKGAQVTTTLLERFPDNDLVSQALAKRGEVYLKKEDFTSALSDFELILDKYPQSKSRELAMERRARIYAYKRMLTETISCYEELLESYPDTGSAAEAHYWIGEGYFEQEQFSKALPHLEAARKSDPELYSNRALIRMIICYHNLKQIPEMTTAARIYIQSGRDAGVLNSKQKQDKPLEIPRHVLASLGDKLAAKRQYQDAEFFLNQIVDLDKPEETEPEVWKTWSTIKIQLKEYHAAVMGFDRMLVRTGDRGQRGFAYVKRGQAQFALGHLDKAGASARECLRVVKQGRVNAEARMLLADIATKNGDLALAAQEYALIGRIFNDPQITPLALNRGIEINSKLGNGEEAARLRKQLHDWAVRRKKR